MRRIDGLLEDAFTGANRGVGEHMLMGGASQASESGQKRERDL